MRRVVWFLDFDGVLNATKPKWSEAPRHRTVLDPQGLGVFWHLRWSPTLIERVKAIAVRDHVEVRWASTWCLPDLRGVPQTRLLERVLGLPVLADAFTTVVRRNQVDMGAAKLRAVRSAWTAGADVIWTDDEWTPDVNHPLHRELCAHDRALLIRPRAREGLTREHLELIEAFVDQT